MCLQYIDGIRFVKDGVGHNCKNLPPSYSSSFFYLFLPDYTCLYLMHNNVSCKHHNHRALVLMLIFILKSYCQNVLFHIDSFTQTSFLSRIIFYFLYHLLRIITEVNSQRSQQRWVDQTSLWSQSRWGLGGLGRYHGEVMARSLRGRGRVVESEVSANCISGGSYRKRRGWCFIWCCNTHLLYTHIH